MAKHHHLYGSRWQKYRLQYLQANPFCVECAKFGKSILATVVDHIKKHDGDEQLFWATDNHQSLCKHCHDSYKQTLEKSGYVKGNDVNGMPIDPNHHWNK